MKSARVELAVESVTTPAGRIWIVCSERGLREVRLGDRAVPSAREGRSRGVSYVKRPRWTDAARQALERYLASLAPLDDVALDVEAGTPFQRQVWDAARRIPIGQVRGYGEVAAMAGAPSASRAVGNALGMNPVPIVIPCHRVIHADLGLGGFSAGLRWKRFLLEHERGQLAMPMPAPRGRKRA
ncbi:MAG TPA: methylated-DNA--[protein]-cysteine S-methyltransferase [Acidobacteriota bacterium]|nr:methylated-DNA--[protein]-cysteine S-methyltransferase [Acidobacteriota bacterium]